ncbi:FixH family protein [Stakelama marina]|uniref:FixH family protein n=1 Tax=Stakelama marina TaxID=2826939 RepID=A0A8T4IG29_9SPHN|nr:FixH family protein [Stakelama marina]MBR0552025.1 FixH family protein [Stakelama marina]
MTKRQFTGWHMTGVMVLFFGVVMAVNFFMAREAIHSFGGVVVENSYVASQRFNGWLAKARAQDKLGWHATPQVANGRPAVLLTGPEGIIEGATVRIEASHPLGRVPARELVLSDDGSGRYVARQSLPAGRWLLKIDIRAQGHDARFDDEIRL